MADNNTQLFQRHCDMKIRAIKELQSMLSSKITTIRSDRTKTIYNYFYAEILPLIEKATTAQYTTIIKTFSKLYRSTKVPADIGIQQMKGYVDEIMNETDAEQTDSECECDSDTDGHEEEQPHIDTKQDRSLSPENPETPTHAKIASKKPKVIKHVKMNKDELTKVLMEAIKQSNEKK